MDAPREKPILFSGPMVRAILENRKSQTRRIARLPGGALASEARTNDPLYLRALLALNAPYKIGDRLWVKESLVVTCDPSAVDYGLAHYESDGREVEPDLLWRWKSARLPSRYMPKSAARLWLEVTGVWAQQLHAISEDDAIAEGVDTTPDELGRYDPVRAFQFLWDSINGKRPGLAWPDNPWVRVYEFKRMVEQRK